MSAADACFMTVAGQVGGGVSRGPAAVQGMGTVHALGRVWLGVGLGVGVRVGAAH